MVPTLISFLKDETPAVARQAITTGTNLFRNVLEKVVVQVKLLQDNIFCPIHVQYSLLSPRFI